MIIGTHHYAGRLRAIDLSVGVRMEAYQSLNILLAIKAALVNVLQVLN